MAEILEKKKDFLDLCRIYLIVEKKILVGEVLGDNMTINIGGIGSASCRFV